MDYVIHALGMPFDGETIAKRSLGGSESAAYYFGRELALRGHRVTMFTNCEQGGTWDGVSYVPAGPVTQQTPLGQHFEFYARNTPHDVLIVQRHPMAFDQLFASKVNILQTHDLALHRTSGMVNAMMWNVSAVTVVSEWHKRQVRDVYGLTDEAVRVVPNGVDPTLYVGCDTSIPLDSDGRLKLLYQSRPERGLEHLVRPGGIMDRLRGVAQLFVCGYDNTTAEMAPYYAQLDAWARALPNVTQLGALTKRQLAGVQKRCDVLCYPTEFEEVSCITAMEAMHAHLPMVTSEKAALPETCAGAGVELIPLKDGLADEDAFVAWIFGAYSDLHDAEREGASILGRMKEAQIDVAKTRTWAHATDDLEALVDECFGRKSQQALMRHALKNADIPLFDHVADHSDARTLNDTLALMLNERSTMYGFLKSDEDYRAHYDRHCGDYYRDTSKQDLRKVPSDTTRWKGVAMLLDRARQKLGRPLKVLDYGCAHGHYSIGLAQAFPDCEFHGIDISADAIREAIDWAGEAGVSNVKFTRSAAIMPNYTYDVVILAEVLEHVRDHKVLLRQAASVLNEGGALLTTTPYGPWEWIGHEAYKTGREHWQHFERADLAEIFAGMNPEIICAPAGTASGRTPVGSWVTLSWPFDEAGKIRSFGNVDIERKVRETLPEQTLSACLIVKDAEYSILKALDSLVPWVTEIVIGLDPATTDRTESVIEHFRSQNPWTPVRVIAGKRALADGFDAARNHVLDQATGDWILWMDADEELVGGDELVKLLRPNMHEGYACPQIHFSVDPPQVLTTDMPSRLFRRNGKIRFYGRVHEHPEIAPGEALPTAVARTEIRFAHNGYITEDKRRERYFRNLPLLMRDVEEHPDRILNKFLLIRDLVQGVGFELQQTGGQPLPDHRPRCERAIGLWRELLDNPKPVARMILDAMPYYTMAAEVIGNWFEANVVLNVAKAPADTKLNIQGKFLRVEDFTTLVNRLSKEATANYDSKYF